MPRSLTICASIFVGACSFEADYAGGGFRCDDDGRCPSGLECSAELVCGPPSDAAVDVPVDIPDVLEAALTCGDPGLLTSGATVSGTTAGKDAVVAPLCNGFVMNGAESVYRIPIAAGDRLRFEILSGDLRAYVVTDCNMPSSCISNAVSIEGVVMTVMPPAGNAFVIVDHEFASVTGAYELSVTIQ